MTAVSNQLPDHLKLKPLPCYPERFPLLSKTTKKVALFSAVFFLSIAVFSAITFGTVSLSISTGMLSGTLVSVIIGIAAAALSKLPTNLESYRLSTLKQMREVATHPRMHRALTILEDFFYYPFDSFRAHFHHHLLHSELAAISDLVDRNRGDAVEVWKKFLEHFHDTPLDLPDGEKTKFSSTMLTDRFEGKPRPIGYDWLSRWSGSYLNDLKAIEEIGKESFGKNFAFPSEKIVKLLADNRPSGVRIARENGTGKVLGYGFYYTEHGVVRIAEIARRPDAARLQIGESLLYEIIKTQKKNAQIEIILRSSNPFAHRLQKWGFIPEKEFPNYFEKEPAEHGVLMKLDWEKFKTAASQQ